MRNTNPLDAVIDIEEADQIVNHIRILLEENLPSSKPYLDNALDTLEELRDEIIVPLMFFDTHPNGIVLPWLSSLVPP